VIFFRFRHLRARQNQLGVIQRGKFPRELADGERVSGVEIGSADIGAAEVYNIVLLTEYRFLRLLGSCLIEGNAVLNISEIIGICHGEVMPDRGFGQVDHRGAVVIQAVSREIGGAEALLIGRNITSIHIC